MGLFIALQSTPGIIAPWATGAPVDAAGNRDDGYNRAFLALGGLVAARFVGTGRDAAHDA